MSDPHRIIPFGKYKGQPVEVLAADRQYLEWLQAQPWFPERFPAMHTLIVNNFGEPEFTPEHNRLQLEFLDPAIASSVVEIARPSMWKHSEKPFRCQVQIEPRGFDVLIHFGPSLFIECKPTIGEDFPAIIRKVNANRQEHHGYFVVVFDQFTVRSVSFDAVKSAFLSSEIGLVSIDEIRSNVKKELPE